MNGCSKASEPTLFHPTVLLNTKNVTFVNFGIAVFLNRFVIIQINLLPLPSHERRYKGYMIIINVKDGESLDKALKRFKKKFEKTGVLRELRTRQAFEKKSVTRRHVVKHAIYKQNMNLETTV